MGKLSLDAVIAKDYPVALATILLTAVFVVFANLLAKILPSWQIREIYEKSHIFLSLFCLFSACHICLCDAIFF
ncbi:hypothetical protein VB002_10120 [Campylobacter concisus]